MFRILFVCVCFFAAVVNSAISEPTSEDLDFSEHFYGHPLWGSKKFDTFLSYKRCDGKDLASLIQARLELKKVKAFLDVRDLCSNHFDKQLFEAIENSKSFILVLTKAALKDLKDYVNGYQSFVYQELKHALENRKNVIPIFAEGVTFPRPMDLLDGIREVARCNGIEWNHNQQDAVIEKLIKFIKGENRSCI